MTLGGGRPEPDAFALRRLTSWPTERDYDLLAAYNRLVALPDLFLVNSVGAVTARDKFVIGFDCDALERRIRQFRDRNLPDVIIIDALLNMCMAASIKVEVSFPGARAEVEAA